MGVVESGVRIRNDLNAFIPEDNELKLRHDNIAVEPLPWKPSKVIEVASNRRVRGVVVAAGPGTYPWRYDGPKGKRTRKWRSKVFVPTTVKVGDIVELAGLEIGEYLHKTITWGSKQVILCQEADVAFICDPDDSP